MTTHEVLNQAPPLVEYNLVTSDGALVEAVRREGAAGVTPALGARLGPAETLALA